MELSSDGTHGRSFSILRECHFFGTTLASDRSHLARQEEEAMVRALYLTAALFVSASVLPVPPIIAQTKQQLREIRETTGPSNSTHQLIGGFKRDRQITRRILRHEWHGYHYTYAYYPKH
jgi:hypothetical protein